MPWRAGERVVETMPIGFMSLDAEWRITYVNPAVALGAGVVILNEPLTPWHLLGLGLILAGSVLATRRQENPLS